VLLMHIMADEELCFPFSSFTEFRNLERAGERVNLDPRSIRASYLDRVRAFLREIAAECGRLKIDYVPLNTRRPFDQALAEYLRARHTPR
jgi:hypothetical protein